MLKAVKAPICMRPASTSRPPIHRHQNHGEAEHEFERGPQHAHQPYQLQAARYVFLIRGFEGCDLRFFLNVGANHPRSGKVFLRPRRNIGEHRLNSFEAIMNAAPEILNGDAHNRQTAETHRA